MVETDVMPAQSKVSRMLVVRGERSFRTEMQTLKFARFATALGSASQLECYDMLD